MKKYEPLLEKNYNEKKQEVIVLDLQESELSSSPPVLFENNLIFLKNNGSCFAYDITTSIQNKSLENKLNLLKLDRLIAYNEKLCGCQLNEGKFISERINTKVDNKFFSLDNNHKWLLDTSLRKEMFNLFINNNLQYNDEFLNVYSAYSHYTENTKVEIANKVKFKFGPQINSIAKDREFYFALTNRNFMTTHPSIFQLSTGENGIFRFVEKYQVHNTSFITSFNINNSMLYLCRRGSTNFLCEYKSEQFIFNSRFPIDSELDQHTYKIINQNNSRILLTRSFRESQPKVEPPFYIIEQDRIVVVKLK